MKCEICNFENPPEEKDFCQKCGSPLSPSPQALESPPAPPPIAAPAPAPPPPEIVAPPAPVVAKLIIPGKGEIPIQALPKIFGREEFVRFLSPDEGKYITRAEHIKITFEEDKYYVQDDKSTNGTKLNGDEIKGMGRKEIKNNDSIVLADVLTVNFQRLN